MHSALCVPIQLLRVLDITTKETIPADRLGGAGGAPCLRHMRLACPREVPWPSLPFGAARLVSLDIEGFPTFLPHATLEKMLTALAMMPPLERLVLRAKMDSTDAAVAFEQLRHIEVGGMSIVGARQLFDHLALPAVVIIRCNVHETGIPDEVQALSQHVVAVKGRTGPLSCIHVLSREGNSGQITVRVTAWRDVDAQQQPAMDLSFERFNMHRAERFGRDSDWIAFLS
ncbi:hypothetical protein FA95DRAFT_1683612 [Auriscalpium vulgare]|uniref:Uncharacterized protein n=1 Tax=Auriscalpium vulgare TaxID=40419 RepID=A0ACB8R9J2_9AGAM|nr:hypothetical protein FA95DRAFT_1683612 [Auriscalpium vulgare]